MTKRRVSPRLSPLSPRPSPLSARLSSLTPRGSVRRLLMALASATVASTTVVPAPALAQALPYGANITLAQARTIAAAAEAEALKNQWPVVISIVDTGGHLVLLHRLDNTQIASVEVAQAKAFSAVGFRRPTKVFEDGVAGPGGARLTALPGAVPIEGGLPIVLDGRIIGAIGISGVTSQQDGVVAAAGLAGLK